MPLYQAVNAAFLVAAMLSTVLLTAIGLAAYAYRLWRRYDSMWVLPAGASPLVLVWGAFCTLLPLYVA